MGSNKFSSGKSDVQFVLSDFSVFDCITLEQNPSNLQLVRNVKDKCKTKFLERERERERENKS